MKLGIGVTFQPKSSEGVFHHIANDPVRGEKLRCGGDALFRDLDVLLELGEGIIFQLGVVILIQPADDLDGILPVFFGNVGNHVTNLQIIPIKAAVPIKHLCKNTQNRSFILVHWRLL